MFALMYTENAENPTRSTILIFEKMIYRIFDCVEQCMSLSMTLQYPKRKWNSIYEMNKQHLHFFEFLFYFQTKC